MYAWVLCPERRYAIRHPKEPNEFELNSNQNDPQGSKRSDRDSGIDAVSTAKDKSWTTPNKTLIFLRSNTRLFNSDERHSFFLLSSLTAYFTIRSWYFLASCHLTTRPMALTFASNKCLVA